jgi:hypothetical protein
VVTLPRTGAAGTVEDLVAGESRGDTGRRSGSGWRRTRAPAIDLGVGWRGWESLRTSPGCGPPLGMNCCFCRRSRSCRSIRAGSYCSSVMHMRAMTMGGVSSAVPSTWVSRRPRRRCERHARRSERVVRGSAE